MLFYTFHLRLFLLGALVFIIGYVTAPYKLSYYCYYYSKRPKSGFILGTCRRDWLGNEVNDCIRHTLNKLYKKRV